MRCRRLPPLQTIGRRGCPYCRGVSRADRIGANRKVSQQHERTRRTRMARRARERDVSE